MKFTTKIPILKSDSPIDYSSKLVLLGSCFAENIGDKFNYYKFQNEVNPFGIIFNPVSIENLIERSLNNRRFTQEDIFFHNERWNCFEVHSELSTSDKDAMLNSLNQLLEFTNNQIAQSSHIIITYGTSWVYRNKDSNAIVANCHKMPQKQFDKEILTVEVIEKSIQNTLGLIRKFNPDCNVIFTVSPVRHIKDGFVENQRSKAHLITAIQNILEAESCPMHSEYFPSYEIMMDELRDYRFYAEDMVHPNQIAIDYIWERFVATAISDESLAVMEEVNSIQKGLTHRPFNPQSESHLKFLKNLQEKISKVSGSYPFMKF